MGQRNRIFLRQPKNSRDSIALLSTIESYGSSSTDSKTEEGCCWLCCKEFWGCDDCLVIIVIITIFLLAALCLISQQILISYKTTDPRFSEMPWWQTLMPLGMLFGLISLLLIASYIVAPKDPPPNPSKPEETSPTSWDFWKGILAYMSFILASFLITIALIVDRIVNLWLTIVILIALLLISIGFYFICIRDKLTCSPNSFIPAAVYHQI